MRTPVRIGARWTAGLAIAAGLAFAGTSDAQRVNFCSQTADLLLDACKADVVDNSTVKKAVCINISDQNARNTCLDELSAEQSDGNDLCQGQHDTRLSACSLLGEGRYDPDLSPARFDNPRRPTHPNAYFPLKVGYRWEYRSATQYNPVEVVNETKLIAGVTCAVFRDQVFEDGQLIEATDDWYTPAKDGSVWYFGEETQSFESFDGDKPMLPELVSIDGTFKTGREGDKPGIIALAAPKPGDVYLEEYSLGNAEDVTVILSTTYAYGRDPDLDQGVPRRVAERFCAGDCIVTKNFSLLEPGLFARKYYARGIGTILEVESEGDVVQLVNCNFDRRCANLPNP